LTQRKQIIIAERRRVPLIETTLTIDRDGAYI